MTDTRLRIIFGFLLIVVLSVLCVIIGLGHVEEKTSFGLLPLIGCLATLAGGWAQWAFQIKKDGDDK